MLVLVLVLVAVVAAAGVVVGVVVVVVMVVVAVLVLAVLLLLSLLRVWGVGRLVTTRAQNRMHLVFLSFLCDGLQWWGCQYLAKLSQHVLMACLSKARTTPAETGGKDTTQDTAEKFKPAPNPKPGREP